MIDAIDSLQPKVELIRASLKSKVRIVSSMGAGGRLNPGCVLTTDLSQLQWDREKIRASNKEGRNVVVAHEVYHIILMRNQLMRYECDCTMRRNLGPMCARDWRTITESWGGSSWLPRARCRAKHSLS